MPPLTWRYLRQFVLGALGIYVFALTLWVIPASGQNAAGYTWTNVSTGGGGGYIPNIIFNTSQKDLVFVRTDIGGAYKWDPSANRWLPLMDWVSWSDWNTLGVESIATDPVDPERLYVAAGTYTNSFTTSNGAILRSTDQGATWQRTDLPFKLGGNMPARSMGEKLAIDPNNDAVLYLGTRSGNGLWKSTDFGATWAKVASFPNPGTYIITPGDPYLGDIVGIAWVLFDPRSGTPGTTTNIIYVGVAQPNGTNIYRSTDAGKTWAAVPGQPTCTLSGSSVSCSDGASWTIGSSSPNHPGSGLLPQHGKLSGDGILYITYSDGAGPFDGTIGDVWKYDTNANTWTEIAPVLPTASDNADYFGYGGLAVDTLHPGTIMVSALNSWWPDTILFRSTDSGATWTRIWDWTSYPNRSLRYTQDISLAPWLNFGDTNPVPPVPSPKLGWMVSGLEIDPFNSDHMLYGTGATLYGTDNLTAWDAGGQIKISVAAEGIEETAVQDLISPPSGAHLYSALGDVSGFRHDSLTTPPATMYSIPLAGTYTSIDYAESSPGFITRVGNGDATQNPPVRSSAFSFDGGASWFQGNNDPAGYTNGGGGTIAAAADASRVVWNPNGLGAFYSTDNGNTWTASSGLPAGGRIGSDRVNPKKFYDYANGTFYMSTDGGVSFTASPATGLPPAGTQIRFKAVPGHEGDIWLAGGSTGTVYGLWHSSDSGSTFTKLANVDQADTVGFGMAAPGKTYPAIFASAQIGGVRGIFRSDDAGATWIQINDSAHQYGMTNAAITGDPRIYGQVYLGTNGRGIILGTLTSAPSFTLSATPQSLAVAPGGSGTSTITVTPAGGFSSSVALSVSGLPNGVTASFSPASTTTTSVLTLSASLAAAAGSATLTITGSAGGITQTATVTLIISAEGGFSIAVSPASLSLAPGGSGTSTIAITRTGGFTGSVACSASGLPTAATIVFNPPSTTGESTAFTVNVPSDAGAGTATITITCTSGSGSQTVLVPITITASNFSLSASPSSVTVAPGASGTSTITVAPSGGFTGTVALSISALPAGVTATFSPTSTTGTSTLTLAASSSAAAGTSTITVTGTSGSLSMTADLSLTIAAPEFSITPSPASLSVAQGASGTSTITITPISGFSGTVAFAASGLPSGVTASFNPASTTGTSSVLTLSASSTASAGTTNITVSATIGTLIHSATIALTVTAGGGVSITPVVSTNSPYFAEEDVKLNNATPITALSITITVARTTGISFSGLYNTVGGSITQGDSSTATAVTYTFTLNSGQTLSAGSFQFAAQMSGTGTSHATSGDTYSVTYTAGGTTTTQSGHF